MRGAAARTPRRFRRLRWAVPIVAVALLSFGANARAETVTVGSPLTPLFSFAPVEFGIPLTVANTALPEPGTHVTSPVSGTIVRWRVLDAAGGPFRLRVLRPAGGTFFTGVGASSPETPASPFLQTFATNLPIQAGDTIGLDNITGLGQLGRKSETGARYLYWESLLPGEPPLPEGATVSASGEGPNLEFAFNADVQPPPTVSLISPPSGPSTGGTAVTIAGNDFNDVSAVSFGANPAASYSVNSESQIVATSPAAPAGSVDVTVTTVAGKSATGSGDVFTFTAPPAPAAVAAAPALRCVVPKLKGRKLKPAKRVLRKRHCRIGKVIRERRKTAPRKARVIKQRPRPRTVRPAGSKVHVWLRVRKKAQHGNNSR